MEKSDTMRLRGGGRGAYDTTGVLKPKPPPIPRGARVPEQTQWEEMNRRQRIHEHFKNATPQTDHEREVLERANWNEEQRRMRWDNDWKVRHSATSMPGNMDAVLPALSALSISTEPTVLKASNTNKSKTKRALAGLRGSLKKPWTKPTESVETEERKAKREKKEKEKVTKKKKKEKEELEVNEKKEKEEKGEKNKKNGKNKRDKRRRYKYRDYHICIPGRSPTSPPIISSTIVALTRLPTELLDNIITYVLPEGFESLALACKKTFVLCTPFVEYHNKLRSQFQDFTYYDRLDDPSYTIKTSFDLITRIAVEPVVARYLRHADFRVDRFAHATPRWMLADVKCGGAVVRLLADSPDLAEAGLDWERYYAKIEEDLNASRYSQYATAFLLTLLPNVETLTLPMYWKPLEATDKLIDVVVRKTKQSQLPYNRPSLAQTTKFSPSVSLAPEEIFDLNWASLFLALPHMRSFRGPSCVGSGDSFKSILSKALEYGIGETLEVVHFVCCSIDEVAITDFLRHTPHLQTFTYSHLTKVYSGRDWDLCKFVTAIEREVGSHLVELSVSIRELHGSINPGETSLRGFQRLRKLEFPLEIAMCNITAAGYQVTTPDKSPTNVSMDHLFIDLIPTSVSRLAINSPGTDHHEQALDIIFREFAAEKASQLPALKDIHLACPSEADDAYKNQCTRLLAETKQVGVNLHLERCPGGPSMTWDGEW